MKKIFSRVTVIITTRNEEDVIERVIKSIKNQSYKNIEIILIDNNSNDETVKKAKKFKIKIFNYGPERSSQRNFGAEKSKGGYLLFLDADMRLSKTVISECVSVVQENPQIKMIVVPEKSVAESYWEKVKSYERLIYNLKGDETTDAARFFEKKVFLNFKGYDLNVTGPEDWDLPERMREKGVISARIRSQIYHYERISSLYSLAQKKFYYAKLSHIYLKKHNIPLVSPKTIYFLRPVFYKNWRILIKSPFMTLKLIFMLSIETLAGGAGFLIGKIQYEKR